MSLVLLAALALSFAGSLLATSIGRTRGVVTLGRLGQGFLFGAIFAGFVANVFEKNAVMAYVRPIDVASRLPARLSASAARSTSGMRRDSGRRR